MNKETTTFLVPPSSDPVKKESKKDLESLTKTFIESAALNQDKKKT